MTENKKTICKVHNEQFEFHCATNDNSKCHVCDLENRINLLSLIFKSVTLEDIKQFAPDFKESSFNDFKSLLFGDA